MTSFDEQPVDDSGENEVRVTVGEGDDIIQMESDGDGIGTVRMTQLEVIDLIASLTRALHVATRNGCTS